MNIKKFRIVLSAILVAAAVFCAIPVSAEGNTYTVSFQVAVSNPKKNIPTNTEFKLVIEGQPHAPLPDPAEIPAGVNGTYKFEPIEFNEPGNYSYTVKQVAPDDHKLIPDTQVYRIDVTVIRSENGDLEGGFTISNQQGNGKPTFISFRNDYKRSASMHNINEDDDKPINIMDKNGKSIRDGGKGGSKGSDSPWNKLISLPRTGEPLSPAFGGLILSGVLFIIFLVVRKRRSGKPEDGGAPDEQ